MDKNSSSLDKYKDSLDNTRKSKTITSSNNEETDWKRLALGGLLGTAALTGAFLLTRFKVAKSNEYLVRTGIFIQGISVDKKAFQLPFQTLHSLELAPRSYSFTIHAMSKEKMEFILPAVFTVGPKDSQDHLYAYSKYLLYEPEENVRDIVRGMIEGETRVLAASMSVEDIFKGRTEFKESIVKNVQVELDKLGLTIFNANIKELQDSAQSKYFSYLAQKISADAENQAKIDIAEARRRGNIGEKEREGTTRQRVSEVESQTAIFENERKNEIEKSQAELDQKRAQYQQQVQVARLEAELNANKRQEELQKEVEMKRLERETERRRASELSKARVDAEIKSTDAAGDAISMKQIADSELYTKMKHADGLLYAKKKEAEGIQAIYEAQAEGLRKIVSTFQGDNRALLSYLMIEKELYPKLAEASAQAIQGLNPKITIWNTGSDGTNNTFDSISGIAKSIPPIIQTIEEQTGLSLPDWLIKKNSGSTLEVEKILKVLEEKGIDSKEVINLLEEITNGGNRQADITNKLSGPTRDKISF